MIRQITAIVSIFFSALLGKSTGALKYILYTGIIAATVFGLAIFGGLKFSNVMGKYLSSLVPWEWAKESILFSVVIAMAVFVLLFMVFKYLIIILLSPLLGVVSEKTESYVIGRPVTSNFSMAASAARSVRINMRNMLKEIILTIFLFILSFVPVLNIVALPLMFLVQAYFAGFGIMDYYLERHHTFKETIAVVYTNKWAAVALGSIFLLLFAVPVLGVIIAPYFTAVAGTKYFAEKTLTEINKIN